MRSLSSKKKKVIALCSSASFYKEVLDIEKQLKSLGFKTVVPITAKRMKRQGNFNVSHHKTWFKNKNDYKKKTQLMRGHFKEILKADAILMVNLEKKGIQGYIGGNGLLEMGLAYHYKKPIYILNNIADDHPLAEEIYGLGSIFLNGDLSIIR